MFWVQCTLELFPTDELPPGVIGGSVGKIVWVINSFDMTLGFPGEGPKWSVISSECRFLCDQLQLPAVGCRCLHDPGGACGRLQPG